ncbi:MAG TPA: GNAT family N-acetyltransferase [Aggregatilineaceae bacterium]|nr:GNAT family N-acetyltransferase [Aggregatilineaceae bacterium]
MSEWTVVELITKDYEAIKALWEAAGLPIKAGGRDSREQFERQMAGGTQTVLGVWDGDCLVAVVVATHDGRKGWINRLAVRPDYRRQGLGQLVVDAAETALQKQGMQIIAALIEDSNSASLALFEQAGYTELPSLHYVSKRANSDV